jgi:ketosteroid isomerase-like protein
MMMAQLVSRPDSLVEAERAFAAKSMESNVREAFLAFFADDGVVFDPGPVNAKDLWGKRPVPPNPPPVRLNWEPSFVEVSRAGDLGYTTGPYVLFEAATKKYNRGYFFSIWKKQIDGKWKVVLDLGIQVPDVQDEPVVLKTGKPSPYSGNLSFETRKLQLMKAEWLFSESSESSGLALAYSDNLYQRECILNRNGFRPIYGHDGTESLRHYLQKLNTLSRSNPAYVDVSKSGDLGYAYGTYENWPKGTDGSVKSEEGYYARVWKRDAKGSWKIVMDTAKAVPPEKK